MHCPRSWSIQQWTRHSHALNVLAFKWAQRNKFWTREWVSEWGKHIQKDALKIKVQIYSRTRQYFYSPLGQSIGNVSVKETGLMISGNFLACGTISHLRFSLDTNKLSQQIHHNQSFVSAFMNPIFLSDSIWMHIVNYGASLKWYLKVHDNFQWQHLCECVCHFLTYIFNKQPLTTTALYWALGMQWWRRQSLCSQGFMVEGGHRWGADNYNTAVNTALGGRVPNTKEDVDLKIRQTAWNKWHLSWDLQGLQEQTIKYPNKAHAITSGNNKHSRLKNLGLNSSWPLGCCWGNSFIYLSFASQFMR